MRLMISTLIFCSLWPLQPMSMLWKKTHFCYRQLFFFGQRYQIVLFDFNIWPPWNVHNQIQTTQRKRKTNEKNRWWNSAKAVQDTNSNMLTLTLLGNMLTIVHDRVKAYNIFIHIIFFTILSCWPHDGVCWFINRQCLENVVVVWAVILAN